MNTTYDTTMQLLEQSRYDLSTLVEPIAVVRPSSNNTHTALRHIRDIVLNGNSITLVVPVRRLHSLSPLPP